MISCFVASTGAVVIVAVAVIVNPCSRLVIYSF